MGDKGFIQSGFISCGALNGGPAITGDKGYAIPFNVLSTPTIIITPTGGSDIRFVIKSYGHDGFSWDKYGTPGNYDGFFWIAFGTK